MSRLKFLSAFFCPGSDGAPVSGVVDAKFNFLVCGLDAGAVHFNGFFGKDPASHNWVKDLFLYYWEKRETFRAFACSHMKLTPFVLGLSLPTIHPRITPFPATNVMMAVRTKIAVLMGVKEQAAL